MTEAANDRRIQAIASAAQTVFTYDFKIAVAADIRIEKRAAADDTVTLLVEGAGNDYTLTGLGDAAGGTYILTAGATANDIYTAHGGTALARETDYVDDLSPATLNADFDEIYRIINRLQRDIDRSIRMPQSDNDAVVLGSDMILGLSVIRANKPLVFDANGKLATGASTVTGPAGSTDNAITRWNGTSGGSLQDSGVIIDDSDSITGVEDLTATGVVVAATGVVTAALVAADLTYPTSDGSPGQAIVTNGGGVLSFSSAGSGDVVGPGATVTDNAVTRFNGTGGLDIQESPVTIDDFGGLLVPASITFSGRAFSGNGTNSSPAYTFTDDSDTGLYLSGVGIGIAAAGSQIVNINAGQYLGPVGSPAAPGVSFLADPDTGMYRASANVLGLAVGGALSLRVDTGGIQVANGSAASPSLSFLSDIDTGVYRVAANRLGFAAGGSAIAEIRSAGIALIDGTAAAPSFTFTGDLDNGMFLAGTNNPAIAAAGAQMLDVTASNVNMVSPRHLRNFTAAVNLVLGDLCYVNGSGQMARADADAETTADTLLGIAQAAITAAASGSFLLYGEHTTSDLTVGAPYYVSTTLGGITAVAPSGTGDIVRRVGTALSATVLWFDGGQVFIEVV